VTPASWPPREQRVRAALLLGKAHLARREWFRAQRAFAAAAGDADGAERELARGLVHVAVARFKLLGGDERGAARQLRHARRRLAPHGARLGELGLATLVEDTLADVPDEVSHRPEGG
jgi:hypothetical protein